MNLSFERVLENEDEKVYKIYEIIKDSGEYMYKEQGLTHWKNPYPIGAIKENCVEREVFLVKNIETNEYVHTFQLEFTNEDNILYKATINKFATIPKYAGLGIGKLSIEFIENYCRKKGILLLCLDVYEKSEHAIRFYEKRGFVITGSKPTKHFSVYLMEKKLSY